MEGSSEMNTYIDSSVGGLVWVRRRNGSWWPGRILGAEELPGSHLLSPRTGTPVKLLGREDGSVDWYNIEKSRRVKAFRCGDFDQCIERAKSLASVLTKKREKYARREDAILHALELERKYTEQNHLLGRNHSSLDRSYKELDFADEDMVLDVGIGGMSHHSNFQNDFMDPESSTEVGQPSLDSLFSLQGDRKFLDGQWEDEIAETIPRMRGLQDFGLRIISSKDRKPSWAASYETSQNTAFLEDENKMVSCITKNTAICPPVDLKASAATKSPASKKKRALLVGVNEEESAYKKRDRRKSFTRLSESRVKHAEDAVDPVSNISSVIPAAGRNGYAIVQPKQEDLVHESEQKSMAGGSSLGGWQISDVEARSSHEMIDSSAIMGRPCSSFSDHMKSNCSEGRSYQYGGSEVEASSLTGSAFVDSILQGGSSLRCTYFPGTAFTSSISGMGDVSIERTSSLSMAENLPSSLSNFPVWSNYSHKEESEFGLRGEITNSAICMPDYPFENALPNNVLPIYPLYNNRVEENSVFAKRNAYDEEGPLVSSRSNADLDPGKASLKSSRQCLLAIEEEGGIHRREDEGDSLQPIPGSSIYSAKAVAVREETRAKQRSNEVSPNFYDSCGVNDLVTHVSQTGEEDSGDEDESHVVRGRTGSPNKYTKKALSEVNVSKWQTKGKRRGSVRSGNMWESTAVRAIINCVAHEDNEIAEGQGLTNGSRLSASRRGRRHTKVEAISLAEEGEGLLERDLEPPQVAYTDEPENNSRGLDRRRPKVRGSSWFDVSVETQPISASVEEHSSFVPLVSKFNGKVILGQPMVVEIIQKRIGDVQNGASVAKQPPLQPVWRTARRTAMQRIPRSCSIIISQPHAEEILDKQRQRALANHKNKATRKSSSLPSSSSANKRRPLKKGGALPQKTRMLSSIAVQHNELHAQQPAAASKKPSGPALVTCIPVSLIFNRIREVLYRGSNRVPSDSDNNNT